MQWPELELPSFGPQSAALAEELELSPLLAQLLVNRGLDASEARQMLRAHPELEWPFPAFTEALQKRFRQLRKEKASLAIFGDYDADGLSGTSVLSVFLRGAGFEVTPVLPTRSEGYGLNADSLRQLADSGHRLLITVDCGISNRAEIELAQQLGLEVVVTDHHGLPPELPDTEFILHPAVLGIEALNNLSGAGMAYWLTVLLAPAFPDAPQPESLLDLAVIGTLADMTPLRGLNFALAKRGLEAAQKTQREGLKALARHKKVELKSLTEDDLTFRMIPMLNAAGRIDSPRPALELLLSDSRREAEQLTQELSEMNTRRQELCQDVLADALRYLKEQPPEQAIVLADPQWLHGVLGITCSQLVQRYHKPVVLMAIEGDYAKASVRAPKGYHILKALQGCDDLLVRYGGHEMAGGFTVRTQDIAPFSARFADICGQQEQGVEHREAVEMEINPSVLSLQHLDELRQLAPFGMGNPAPVFLSLNVPLKDTRCDFKSGTHFFAELNNNVTVKGWQMWRDAYKKASHFDLIYQLERNTWRGKTQLQITLKHLRIHEDLRQELQSEPRDTAALQKNEKQGNDRAVASTTPKSQKTTHKPLPARAAPPQAKATAQESLPGWFFDGEQYWRLSAKEQALSAAAQWQDKRRYPRFAPGPELAQWVAEHPPDAQIQLGQAEQFQGIILNQPPGPVPPAFWQQTAQYYLAPLRPLPPLPSFRFLWEILETLQESGDKISSAKELARQYSISKQQAEYCLGSLCDLGLLAYDRERYKLHYKNQLYDLRQSPCYRQASQRYQQRQVLAQQWYALSSEQLIKALRTV